MIVKLFKDANLYDRILNSISTSNMNRSDLIIYKTKLIIEYRINTGLWPTCNLLYKEQNIGKFYYDLRYRLFKHIKLGKITNNFKIERDEIFRLLRENNLYNELIEMI